jgi:SWI/SNF-related matrix-associated actin-dependent regulator of chromatin subfamily A containing DEAD/H box 1
VAVTVELPYTNGTNSSHHSNSPQMPAAKKARYEASGGRDDSDDDEFEGGGKPNENVFDSDAESDDDNQFYMTKDRRLVFEFLNTATASEIMNIRGCSAKKTDILIRMRPFSNWEDLVSKLKSGRKFINTDVLNFCQEHLKRQHNLQKIMKKCSSIVTKLENAISKGGNLIAQPSILNPDLKLADYQMIGINWLSIMHDNKVNGILADEMGLGKTIQVIAFLAYLKENKLQTRPHLIVVPSSTMDNWEAELIKWCPSLQVVKYYGSQEDRRAMRIQWAKKGLVDIDILLTT